MKKLPVCILTLIAGLTLSACGSSNYIECSEITYGKYTYYGNDGYNDTYQLVVQYHTTGESTYDGDDGQEHFINFFVNLEKDEEVPSFPNDLVIHYSSYDGDHGYRKLEFVKTLGTYRSYRHCFISKDEKTIKYDDVTWEVIDAPYDNEAQGKNLWKFDYYDKEIKNVYYAGCIVYFIETQAIHETIDIKPELKLSYKVLK